MTLKLTRRLKSPDYTAIAALARVDPRSVKRYTAGSQNQHPVVVDAIERALRKLELVAPNPEPSQEE